MVPKNDIKVSFLDTQLTIFSSIFTMSVGLVFSKAVRTENGDK